jgi:hypothetical protein
MCRELNWYQGQAHFFSKAKYLIPCVVILKPKIKELAWMGFKKKN